MNFFFRSKTTESTSSRGPRRRRLDRRNAAKYYEYRAASWLSSYTSFLDVSTSSSASLHSRSVNSVDPTSFRIHGDEEDQLELIIRRLGLSGVEDLSISNAAWESMKTRSLSDLLPRSELNRFFSSRGEEEAKNCEIALDIAVTGFNQSETGELDEEEMPQEVIVGVAGATEWGGSQLAESTQDQPRSVDESIQNKPDELHAVTEMVESPGERLQHILKVEEEVRVAAESIQSESTESTLCFCDITGCGGSKGIMLPELKPPPSIKIPPMDSGLSTWDLIRDFAPAFEPNQEIVAVNGSVTEKREVVEEEEEDDRWLRVGETVMLSSSCSFTATSNDEDCSSTSPEPKSTSISPNMKVKKVITVWQKNLLLGHGSFGSVYEALSDDGSFFAVKEVSLLDQGPAGKQKILQLEQEIALLSRFEHENIVQYYGTDKDDSNLYIFIELMTSGSLTSLYRRFCLKDSQISAYTRQILRGLKYLHEQAVVHRDIKCANILVDASGSVKLADFGIAKATTLNDIKSCKGTAFWMAPEVVKANNHGGYGLPADIWSLGCTVLEMFTREVPYHPLESMPAVYRIGKGELPTIPDTLSRDARHFILKCLQVNPADRPTAAQLLCHPFVERPPSIT